MSGEPAVIGTPCSATWRPWQPLDADVVRALELAHARQPDPVQTAVEHLHAPALEDDLDPPPGLPDPILRVRGAARLAVRGCTR
jgi:hypothetical protein